MHDRRSVGEAPAADFGDVRAEFAALVSGCGVFDLGGRAKLRVSGEDRVRWLNGMVTNNVRDLAPGQGVYAFLLNPQGRILDDLYVYNHGDSLLLDVDGARVPQLLELFDHYIIMDDVEVVNVSEEWTAIGVAGARAAEVLAKAGLSPELAPLQFAETSGPLGKVVLVRGDHPAVAAYELWVAPGEAAKVWDGLVRAGATPAGASAVELSRIAAGVSRYGQDIRERDLPQETGQERALNFSKGCYIGQEIVERIRSRGNVHRMFGGFRIEGALPAPGTKLQVEGKEVGEITSSASLPVNGGEMSVALGYIRREAANKAVQAGAATAAVAATPFAGVFPASIR
jgi:folate-binding protein YgfZ